MKKDFLILFELKNREIENAALLATELRKRGYSVEVLYINAKDYLNEYRVILTPNLANNNDLFFVLKSAKKMSKKIILMKQEQALSINGEKAGWGIPTESARRAHMIAWGQSMEDRLEKIGINQKQIHKVGNIALDFNHSDFDRYFYSREQIIKKYGLNDKKHIHLFISSFSHCNLEEYYVEHLKSIDKDTERQIEIAEKSQKELLKWFRKIVKEHEDIILIYRPHPVENIGKELYQMEMEFPNFIINKDFSIRQWIRIANSISLWYSTSIADIAYCKKKCMILRPYEYPDDIDEIVLRGGKYVKSFEEFDSGIKKPDEVEFPIREEIIHYYFGDKFDGKSYIRLADVCERVLKSFEEIDYKRILSVSRLYSIKVMLIKLFCTVFVFVNPTCFLPVRYKKFFTRLYLAQKDYKKLFDDYCRRLEKII